MNEDPALECQDCGDVVYVMSAAEAQKVAAAPYNFIVQCDRCAANGGPSDHAGPVN